jgi:Ca-activated chloride channel family protein
MVISGRYTAPAKGTLRLRGRYAGRPIVRDISVDLPAAETKHDVLATLWARNKVDSLMHAGGDAREEITKLGLDYRLMTPYTSFVAVEETIVTEGGVPRRVDVPVELPEGVSYEGIFGSRGELSDARAFAPVPFAGPSQAITMAQPMRRMAATEAVRVDLDARPESKLSPALAKAAGVVRIQVLMKDTSEGALATLKKLGFVITGRAGNLILGRIDSAKLRALADLPVVRYVSPGPR